jgi:hypothetical protein
MAVTPFAPWPRAVRRGRTDLKRSEGGVQRAASWRAVLPWASCALILVKEDFILCLHISRSPSAIAPPTPKK